MVAKSNRHRIHIHTYIHAHAHTHTHTCTDTHIHTHMHKHSNASTPTHLLVAAHSTSSPQASACLEHRLLLRPFCSTPSEHPHQHYGIQVVIQQLSGIGTVGALNLCDEALSNHFLTLKSQQIKCGIHHLKELLFVFLKDLRCCTKRERERERYSSHNAHHQQKQTT